MERLVAILEKETTSGLMRLTAIASNTVLPVWLETKQWKSAYVTASSMPVAKVVASISASSRTSSEIEALKYSLRRDLRVGCSITTGLEWGPGIGVGGILSQPIYGQRSRFDS